MDKINVLAVLDNGDITIKDLDEIDKSEYNVLPIMDLSSYGNEIVGHLTDIGCDVLKDILEGKVNTPKDFKKTITKKTLTHFGISIKPNKKKSPGKLKDIKGMELSEFAIFSAILIVVNAKLEEIISREKSIVDFLEIDKQTELKANFLTLNTIVREYHHNFESEKFLTNREMQVLDIRRSAEHSILFYKEMAEKKVNAFRKGIHVEIDKALAEIQGRTQFYKLALYIYAYSSFLDVVLLENFSASFIDSIIEDITNHSTQYVEYYEDAAKVVKHMAESSGKSQAMKGASSITSGLSKLFGKMKADKQADKLENSSKSLSDKRSMSVDDMVNKFSNNADAGVQDIVDNLIWLKNIHSKQSEIIVDAEYIYIEKK